MGHRSVSIGPDKQVPPLCGLEGRVPPPMGRRAIRADGKFVKAKAFTKKRR
ncbi:hypothetical protein THTE_0893 [Thermogutta terrifontis]|uniref:Uncharacterized protein n=1 Tax=Thermogutta terrifontis TaxID=1331910 RepID=A0A286RC23_9BACT|nr:hypothetical protein THTE_0893 [Thermogutta terrifontis]